MASSSSNSEEEELYFENEKRTPTPSRPTATQCPSPSLGQSRRQRTRSRSLTPATATPVPPLTPESGSPSLPSTREFSGNRGPNRKSKIWQFFDTQVVLDPETKKEEIRSKCKVKNCDYVSKGCHTTNLKGHLKSKHVHAFKQYEALEVKAAKEVRPSQSSLSTRSDSNQQTMIQMFGAAYRQGKLNPYARTSSQYASLKNNLTTLASCTSFPLALIEKDEFRQLIRGIDVRAADSLPTRNGLKAWVLQFGERVSKKVAATLQESLGFFVCIDLLSQTGLTYAYIGIVAVFYNQKSKRFERVGLCCR